jgi:hypothetical protein
MAYKINTYCTNILIILLIATYSFAQDSNFVKKYDNLLSLKTFNYSDGFTFSNKATGLKYIPDNHSGIGLGVWFKYLPFDIFFRQEINIASSKYHNIRTTDMQLKGYCKFFVGDIYIQRYRGFYEKIGDGYVNDNDLEKLPYKPDLSVFQFDMIGKYIFNHEQFSYKAGFTANERQLISAGSVTVGAALYFIKIRSDSLLVARQKCDLRSCNFGFNVGYAYNYVFGKRSTLFASGMLGINASASVLKNGLVNGVNLSPTLHIKLAYWLNYNKWSYGITATYNIIHHTINDDFIMYIHTRRAEMMVIRRIWCKSHKSNITHVI